MFKFNFFRAQPKHDEITPVEMQRRLARGERLYLLDVREREEYAESHIPDSVLIPLGQLSRKLSSIPKMRPSSLSVAPATAVASPPICCAAPDIARCSTCAAGLLHGRGRDCRWLCDIPSGRTLCAVRRCSFPLCAVCHRAKASRSRGATEGTIPPLP